MQLNMGEGKTSVIVPIVAAELANGRQLCTVTVLRHMFQTNLRSLRQCVGGMLQRRVYTMPCRRDMDIDAVVTQMQTIYEECTSERGILITLPEYRLSLQLKLYDSTWKGNFKVAENLLDVHKWLNRNCRHILDESDAILQPNYQLIYTVGEQLGLDGGELRWTCIQAVLKRVPFHMMRLYKKFGDQKIEFKNKYVCDRVVYGSGDVKNRPEVFRPCRLLDTSMYEKLKEGLVNDFVNGNLSIQFPETTPQLRKQLREVLINKALSVDDLQKCLNQFECQQKTILILCGILKFDVLQSALSSKRWRVNYGPNVHSKRKMAVPYKAKDVAADMSEFGHPDVAICLTQLSYYYSGLSDTDLRATLELLESSENPNEIYDEWIRCVPAHLVHFTIKSWTNINLSDTKHCNEHLYPILRRNMYVVDFWLSQKVFPTEAKLFTKKLMCTAWDLCPEHLSHPVTGFSGTNDMSNLLPLHIVQNDLPALKETNENVRQILLRQENDNYKHLSSNISGTEILKKLTEETIPILIDAGALMLELNNEQVARKWLALSPTAEAAIYFSDKDIMLTINRKGFITEFEYSVYRERLYWCVVYLDDVHTRGTDLKFPRDMRACVTLSGGITRDKTVQACMRMRMLGDGHKIAFWASHEADIGIRKLDGKSNRARVTSADILKYVEDNSKKFEENSMCYWSSAATNYTRKCAAHKRLEAVPSSSMETLLKELRENCSESQNLTLADLYGAKKQESLQKVARNGFNRLEDQYENDSEIYRWIRDAIKYAVDEKMLKHATGVTRFTQFLEEKHEKELECELEENREVYPPQAQTPHQPKFNARLATLFGQTDDRWKAFNKLKMEEEIESLPRALQHSQLFSLVESEMNVWDDNLWVTKDFCSVIQLNGNFKDDEYLRPVWWIVRIHADDTDADDQHVQDTFVIISPFECNHLIDGFRQTNSKATLHMFSAKVSPSQSNLINNKALQLPSNPSVPNIPLKTLVQQSMFAGSTFFDNADEEKAYCNFMGIVPNPRTIAEQEALDKINQPINSGYIPQRYRENFPNLTCDFLANPEKIAIGIIERRHNSSRKRSHVGQLFYELKRCKWENDETPSHTDQS